MYNFITKNILIFRQNKRNYFIVKGLRMKMLRERPRLKKNGNGIQNNPNLIQKLHNNKIAHHH